MRDRNQKLARSRLDDRFRSFRPTEIFASPSRGWLRAIRDALGMKGDQLAARLGSTRQRVSQMERAETEGSITLNTLRKAAGALDCTLVYAIVPRRSLDEIVRDRARALALRELGHVDRTMELEDQAVSDSDLEDRIADYIRENIREADLWDDH